MFVAELTSEDISTPAAVSCAADPARPSSAMPHDDRILGHALYFYTYSTWTGKCLFLEDLCVREEYRSESFLLSLSMCMAGINILTGRGIGSALMQECAKVKA